MKQTLNLFLLIALLALTSCTKKELLLETELNSNWSFKQVDKGDWLPATVPGTVHTDLIDNKKIEDPFYRLNEHDVQWVDKVDWEYKTVFDLNPLQYKKEKIELVFEGLDTYADVFLNDSLILNADNMFRQWKVEVKNIIKEKGNQLKIVLKSPIKEGIKKHDANDYLITFSGNDLAEIGKVEGNKRVSVFTRKAGYHFGWDWGPRLVTSGIWRPIKIKAWDKAKIQDLFIQQKTVTESVATLKAMLEIESLADNKATISISNDKNQLATKTIQLKKGTNIYDVDFEIKNPKLWWSNGLGEQHLYKIDASLVVDNQIATATDKIGIRTIEFVREKDADGTSFYFKLNGHPVFMKGANYIPNDIFLPRVTDEQYKKVIATAKNSNMNMLRVWGGGIYENDIFYDLCDENGILIWQDFMFACAMYPGDSAFLQNVKYEAIDNIKRLRNHACLAFWCGNNENLDAWLGWGWKKEAEAKNKENADKMWQAYKDVFHKILREAVQKYDPSHGYWASSPSSGQGIKADLINGDHHYWGVWWGKEPFSTYATHLARFMSEYGFQSFPDIGTVEKYAKPEDYDIFSEVMKSHQRSSIGNGTIKFYMDKEYNEPKDFESFLYVNHILQAEGIKFGLEGHRRAMPFTMGSLYWQINDVWPVASWSSTDYYQKWKALQYYVKKSFEPVLVSPYFKNDSVKVAVVNDLLEDFDATLQLKIIDFSGKVLWENEQKIKVKANSSTNFFEANKKKLLRKIDAKKSMLVTNLLVNDELKSSNSLFFLPFKKLTIEKPAIQYTIKPSKGGFDVTITTDKLAKNVYLRVKGAESFFSDNYFDVLPGESKTVHFDSDIDLEKLTKNIQVRTLEDAF
ncbi:MAG: beta-mannosidase [Draconibacterium sp.]|nr:MAG: beta-mannosidase [Draconibacterium sp.]